MLRSLLNTTTVHWFWCVTFWLLVVVTLCMSLVPVVHVPSAFSFWDKAQHAVGFAALAFSGLLAYPGRIRFLVLGLVLFGVGIEIAQWLTGWRHGDWQDWVADCVGISLGYLALRWLRRLPMPQ